MKQLSLSEKLLYSTTRIVCYSNNRTIKSMGTGFIYGFCRQKNGCYPALVTNKHVVKNADECELTFHIKNSEGNPSNEKITFCIKNNFKEQCIYHPEENVDLAIYNLSNAFYQCKIKGKEVFYSFLDKDLIPSKEDLEKFSAIEDIIMIGYPNGLIDEQNNLPIVRKGITATPFFINYNGNQQFLADMACYPGSSGSPVLILQEGISKDKFGNMSIGKSTIKLLGINSSVYLNTITGNLVSQDTTSIKPLIQIPNNLAIIIKAEKLNDFEKIIKNIISRQES